MNHPLWQFRKQGAEAQKAALSLDHRREVLEASLREIRQQEAEKKGALDSVANQNQTMGLLMKAKDSGQLPGFYGLLGVLSTSI